MTAGSMITTVFVLLFLPGVLFGEMMGIGNLLGLLLESLSSSWEWLSVEQDTVLLATAALAGILLLVYLAQAAQTTISRRWGTSWKDAWFPDFDDVWSGDDSLRSAFEEAAQKAWDYRDKNELIDTLDSRIDQLDDAQKTMVRELQAIACARRSYIYHEDMVEKLETVTDHEMHHPQSRLAVFESGVDGLLRSDAENRKVEARKYLAEAQNIRERLLIEA